MSDIDKQNPKIEPAQWSVVAIAVAFAAGAFLYKLLMHERLGHSAAMFLGIPTVLAILLALAPKAKTATGGILKGITLALLVVAPWLGEGYLCILFASPLFYIVGIGVGAEDSELGIAATHYDTSVGGDIEHFSNLGLYHAE